MRLQYDPTRLQRITDAKQFGRVAVLLGGDSSEREISLLSGNAVLEALQRRGVDAYAFDTRDRALASLLQERSTASGSRCTARAERTEPYKAPSNTLEFLTPAAV